ncbi:MAG: beta strand repeat-containing protein [Actinomycetales bacterium]
MRNPHHSPARARSRRFFAVAVAFLLVTAGTVLTAPSARAVMNISGVVHHDTDGLDNGMIDGPGIGQLGPYGQLYATAVGGGVVAASATVAGDGSYTLSGLADGTYQIFISRYDQTPTIGSAPGSGAVIPADWQFTAEGTTAVGDGTPNGSVTVSSDSVPVNFGVRQIDTDRDGTPDTDYLPRPPCWDVEYAGDGVGVTAGYDATFIMHSGASGTGTTAADAFKPRNTTNIWRIAGSVADVGDLTAGPGLTLVYHIGSGSHGVSDDTATTLEQAKSQGAYVQYTFTTDTGFAMAYADWGGFLNRVNQESFDVVMSISEDGQHFYDVHTFNEPADSGDPILGKRNADLDPFALAHSTTYTVRYYFYNVDAPIDFDDPFLAFDACPYVGISGNLYLDGNGNTDGSVNGTGTPSPSGTQMYATLVDQAGNVIRSVALGSAGNYFFGLLPVGTFRVQMGTEDLSGSVGQPAPSPSLPAGYAFTGEHCCNSPGDDGTADGNLLVPLTTGSLHADFGTDRSPIVVDVSASRQLNPGGTNQVQVPALNATDPEGGALIMVIQTLPTNATLYYDGVPVTAGQQISNYDSSLLTVDPQDGTLTASFTYSAIDSAGLESPTTATAEVLFGTAMLTLVKSVSGHTDVNTNSVIDVGDRVTYQFTLINAGSLDISGITLTDPNATITGGPIALTAGTSDTTTFTGTHTITAADVAAGGVETTATASGTADGTTVTDTSDAGTDPSGAAVADPAGTETPNPLGLLGNDPANPGDDPTTFTITPDPRLELTKSITGYTDVNANNLVDVGDRVTYGFTLTNTGNVTVADITLIDPIAGVSGGPLTLTAGTTDSTTFTGVHTITPADIVAMGVENTATATGTGAGTTVTDTSDAGTAPDGTPVTDPAASETPNPLGLLTNDPDNPGDDPTTFSITHVLRLELIKSVTGYTDVNGDQEPNEGDLVTYAFIVRNTGNVPLADITVTDDNAIVIGGPISLFPGVSDSGTFTATHQITLADLLAGAVENTASTTGNYLGTPTTDLSDTGVDADGDPVADPGAVNTRDPFQLLPNSADPGDDPSTFEITADPRMELTKSVTGYTDSNGNGVVDVGDVIHYGFSVFNTGNVELTLLTVNDANAVVAGGPMTLDPGATDTTTFTAAHVITTADIAAGGVENAASATGFHNDLQVTDSSDAGTDPDGATITDPENTETPNPGGLLPNDPGDHGDDPSTFTIVPDARLVLIKSVAGYTDVNGNGLVDAGDQVSYEFTLTNIGNAPITGITVSDPAATVTGGPIALAAGDSDGSSFAAEHTITTAEVSAGGFENVATASGDHSGTAVTDSSDAGTDAAGNRIADPGAVDTPSPLGTHENTPATGDDPTTFAIEARPALTFEKSVTGYSDRNGNGYPDVGDVIQYSFLVANTGNVDLVDVQVLDANATVTGGPIRLPVGSRDLTTFTASHLVTQADIAAGGVENIATATGTDGVTVIRARSDAGTDSAGRAVSDPAGTNTGSPLGLNGNSSDPGDDPTTFLIPPPPPTQSPTQSPTASPTSQPSTGDPLARTGFEGGWLLTWAAIFVLAGLAMRLNSLRRTR